MSQHATLITRPGKSDHVLSAAEELASWEAKASAAEVQDLCEIADAALHAGSSAAYVQPGSADLSRYVSAAVSEVQRQHATWTASQLAYEISRQLPPLPPEVDHDAYIDDLVAAVLGSGKIASLKAQAAVNIDPLGVRESDGRSVYSEPACTDRYSSTDHIDKERFLVNSAA